MSSNPRIENPSEYCEDCGNEVGPYDAVCDCQLRPLVADRQRQYKRPAHPAHTKFGAKIFLKQKVVIKCG